MKHSKFNILFCFIENIIFTFLFQSIENEAKQEVEAAVKAAQGDPDPTLDDLFLDVYADDNMDGHKRRGCDNWSRNVTN